METMLEPENLQNSFKNFGILSHFIPPLKEMEIPFITSQPVVHHELLSSVWLYSTEKGRENKKRPYRYWMNNTEMFFEVYISHPVPNPDVSMLLELTYKSFVQNARIYSYENEKKNGTPMTYIPSNVFSNPMVDDIRLVTLTQCGWRIPFRCHISLPIDKVRYIKLYINNSSVEFGIYSKASSKNKLDAGTPVLFPLMRENEVAMVSGNLPATYLPIPTNHLLPYPAAHQANFLASPNSPSSSIFPYDNYFNHPPNVHPEIEDSSDENYSGDGSDLASPKREASSLRSSSSSMGLNNLALDNIDRDSSSSEYEENKKKTPRQRRMHAENRRKASLKKLRSSSENILPVVAAPTLVKRSVSSDTTRNRELKVEILSPRQDLSASNDASINSVLSEADRVYLDTRQFSLVDGPMQLDPVSKAGDFGWVLGKRTPTTEHKLCK